MSDKIRFGILTVSDRCSRGEYADESGNELEKFVEMEKKKMVGTVTIRKCIPDELDQIKLTLEEWCDNEVVDVILTTGGTGFSLRDVTPEATKAVIERDAPGLVVAMIKGSLDITRMAMLSRPVCGIRKKTIIVNLPGSTKSSLENFKIVVDQLKHAVDLIQGRDQLVSRHHSLLSSASCSDSDSCKHLDPPSKVDPTSVADRARKSPFTSVGVTTAQETIIQECCALVAESTSLTDGLGRILAQDVFAKDPLPPFRASVKDGYAVKVKSGMDVLQVAGDSTAGENPDKCELKDNYCVRISTGAPVPEDADAVIQVEDTELIEKSENGKEEKTIKILRKPTVGQDIRPIGSDIRENEKVLQKGTKLGCSELGILAAVGNDRFLTYKKPVIGLLSTGNELNNPCEPLVKGKIRDSNKTTLAGLFQEAGFEIVDLGIARDTPDEVLSKLRVGLSSTDVVVSTGGVSMGERDYLKQVLLTDLKSTIHFGSVLMKPGKPTTFATCMVKGVKKLVFSLPGNPVSATVTANLFVIPACRKLSGWQNPFQTIVKAKILDELRLDTARPEFHRVIVSWDQDDQLPTARSTGNQISSRLLSCSTSNGLLILPQGNEEKRSVKPGAVLEVLMTSSI